MKKTFTYIITMILCAIITITGISAETAYAADKTSLKVTFNKKSVNFNIDEEKGLQKINVDTLIEKWGNPEITEDEYSKYYTWKKGKSEVQYGDIYPTPMFSGFHIIIYDKNATVCGLKVGMTKSKATKIMKKLGGKKDAYGTDITAKLASERISIICNFKKGKVSSISCTAYAEDVSE